LKVLDVHPLKDRLHRNITMHDRLGNEMETIDRAVQGLVAIEDSLTGEGGNAIRTFYADCHLPFLQFFKLLLHHEFFESKYEGIFQTNYRSAHDKTIESERPWNWEKCLKRRWM